MALLSLLGGWDTPARPDLLLIVREQVRPRSLVAYDRIETEIQRACRRWGCPNAYVALTALAAPHDVWWLTAWSSQDEIDEARARYARNRALAARLGPLNARKRLLTEESSTSLATAVGQTPLTLSGARFAMVTTVAPGGRSSGALYDLPEGRRIAVQSFRDPPTPAASGSVVLAIRPNWSLPPPAFTAADPAFWSVRA